MTLTWNDTDACSRGGTIEDHEEVNIDSKGNVSLPENMTTKPPKKVVNLEVSSILDKPLTKITVAQ